MGSRAFWKNPGTSATAGLSPCQEEVPVCSPGPEPLQMAMGIGIVTVSCSSWVRFGQLFSFSLWPSCFPSSQFCCSLSFTVVPSCPFWICIFFRPFLLLGGNEGSTCLICPVLLDRGKYLSLWTCLLIYKIWVMVSNVQVFWRYICTGA